MSVPGPVQQEPAEQEYVPLRPLPPRIGGWSFFDKVRFRWGGLGDIVLGIACIGGGHSAPTAVFGVLFILLGIATWIITGFGAGGAKDSKDWYKAWCTLPTPRLAIAGTGAVIGVAFAYALFFWFFILRLVWRYVIAPSL